MKRDNVNYLLVGGFVLAMAGVLFYTLYRLTGHGGEGDVYLTHFPNVAGIKEGSLVTFEGFEVGNVAAIEPVRREGRTWYKLRLNLNRKLRVPSDSRAMIATPGLLAAPLVEIKEGSSAEVILAGGEIPGSSRISLMDSVATLATDLDEIARTGLKPLLAQISRRVDSLGGSLDKEVPAAIGELRGTLSKLNSTAGRIESMFDEQNRKHWSGMLRNADQASANAVQLSNDMHAIRLDLDSLLKDSRGIITGSGKDIQHSLAEIREALRRANAVLYQMESTGRNLNEFSRHIRENPAALIQSRPPVDAAGETRAGETR